MQIQNPDKKWELELWVNENGSCPVAEFFDELSRRKNVECERVKKLLNRFQTHSLLHLRQSQDIGRVINEEFWEIRFSVGIEVRLLGVIREENNKSKFIAVHGFHKKDQKIRKSDIDKACDRIQQIT